MQTEAFEHEVYLIEKIQNIKEEKLQFVSAIYLLTSVEANFKYL